MNFHNIFNDYYNSLLKHKKQLGVFGFDCERIRMIIKTLQESGNLISYSFTTMSFYIEKKLLPSHSIPKEFKYIEIVLSISDEIKINKINNNHIQDPINQLDKFNISLFCDKKNYTSSWHLDRDIPEDHDGTSSNLHPLYHLTFGGYHMENLQKEGVDEFGRLLILRTPRIMHPPMELILGIDFIFNHFIPKNELELLGDHGYLDIIKKVKKYFWLPYSLAIAKNYCERISIDNQTNTFDSNFVNSVIG
jgi:hypothetical protein